MILSRPLQNLFTTFFLLCFSYLPEGRAQTNFRVLFYNVENGFDTTDNPMTQDEEYLPQSGRHWTNKRYTEKIQHLAKVLTASGEWETPAIIGLSEIENDSVIYRLLNHTPLKAQSYRYCMTHGSDPRGINVALLYQRDQFCYLGHNAIQIPFRDTGKRSRDLLHVWGKVSSGDTLDVFVCHFPSRYGGEKASEPYRLDAARCLRHLCDSLFNRRKHPCLLIMGDFNDSPRNKSMRILSGKKNKLTDLFKDPSRLTQPGSHKYQGKWLQLDQLWVNSALLQPEASFHYKESSANLFDPPFLFTEDKTYRGKRPFRTYYGYTYEGGFSDHLPIRADFTVR